MHVPRCPWPAVAEDHYLIPPVHISSGYALSLSTAQLVGLLLIAFLTWTNTRGLDYGKFIQNVFTTAKTGALIGLTAVGLLLGWNADAVRANFGDLWTARGYVPVVPGVTATTAFGQLIALCVSQTGSLFSSDAWDNITFTAGEVKNPRHNIPLSLALGTGIVTALYLLANLAYILVLPVRGAPDGADVLERSIQFAAGDRVGRCGAFPRSRLIPPAARTVTWEL